MCDSPEYLATLQILGLADEWQVNTLMEQTIEYAKVVAKVAVRNGWLLESDVDDIAQEVALKALRYLPKWQMEKGGWRTFVSAITSSTIADQGRRYAKEARLANDLADILGYGGEMEDIQGQ